MKTYIKRSFPFFVTLLLAVLFLRRGIQWHDLQAALHQAQWGWLLLALFWQAGAYGAVAWLNELLLQRYGARVPFGKQYVIQLAMAFIEAAVPTASVSGAVLRIRLLKPHHVSADVATVTTMAEMGLISASVVLFALPVIGSVMLNGALGMGTLNRWLLILIGIAVLIIIMIKQWRARRFVQFRAQAFQAFLRFWDHQLRSRWTQQLGAWPSQRLHKRLQYLGVEFALLLHERPFAILLTLLARSGFEALGLMMCFYALGQYPPIATILLIYTFTIAINTLVGAIPGGIGLAEVSLAALYAQFGISTEMALAIALTYRLTDYWLPRLVGGIAWLWLERGYSRQLAEVTV
ncbi:MAG: lysylphosphatidylglycerol synthase transmembrane domain-containing protein [Anaerolineales bacterium]|nr:lysylphosphatidylglycerol synthase transmembrane domain-containing protein [Anaerolineales bacterium]